MFVRFSPIIEESFGVGCFVVSLVVGIGEHKPTNTHIIYCLLAHLSFTTRNELLKKDTTRFMNGSEFQKLNCNCVRK
jgi:hypothetical protein